MESVRTPAHDTAEVVISDKALSWAFCEEFIDPDEQILQAGAVSQQVGCCAGSAGTGAALSVLTPAYHARAVVDVGRGEAVAQIRPLGGKARCGGLTSSGTKV